VYYILLAAWISTQFLAIYFCKCLYSIHGMPLNFLLDYDWLFLIFEVLIALFLRNLHFVLQFHLLYESRQEWHLTRNAPVKSDLAGEHVQVFEFVCLHVNSL